MYIYDDNDSSTALPPPNVTTTSDGDMSLGSSLILTCEVYTIDRLVLQPSIVWTKQASLYIIIENTKRMNNTLTLTISSVKTSDAGQYTCIANISTYLTANSSEEVILQSKPLFN